MKERQVLIDQFADVIERLRGQQTTCNLFLPMVT